MPASAAAGSGAAVMLPEDFRATERYRRVTARGHYDSSRQFLLDNMTPVQVKQAVAHIHGKALVEVSGGVTLETVSAYAEAGADVISLGALTHSAPAVDLSLELSMERRS